MVYILVILAHPDDAELCCAGTLLSAIDEGLKVGMVDLTRGELGTRGTDKIRLEEAADAAKVIGAEFRFNLGLRDGFISMAHGRELSAIKSYKNQLDLYEKIISKKLSVRETEKIIRGLNTKKPYLEYDNLNNKFYQKKVNLIAERFGVNLNLKILKKGGGQIIIPFKSKREFDEIIKKINDE